MTFILFFFFSSRRRHTRLQGDWSSDVCSSDLRNRAGARREGGGSARSSSSLGLVPELSHPGEHHREAGLISRRDDIGILHGAARLDDGAHAGAGRFFYTVREGKEGIRS